MRSHGSALQRVGGVCEVRAQPSLRCCHTATGGVPGSESMPRQPF